MTCKYLNQIKGSNLVTEIADYSLDKGAFF